LDSSVGPSLPILTFLKGRMCFAQLSAPHRWQCVVAEAGQV
jgi:hypothetical protein